MPDFWESVMLSAINARNSIQIPNVNNKVKQLQAFKDVLSNTTVPNNARVEGTLEISALAKSQASRSASPHFNNSYFERLGTMTLSDMAVQVGKDADALSASQGLPSGKYDFTSLTTGQAWLVVYNLKNNLHAPYDAIVAFDTNIPTDCDDTTVYNMVEPIKNSAQYEKETGNTGTADWLNAALDMVARFSSSAAQNGPADLYRTIDQLK